MRRWTASAAGSIRITGAASDIDPNGGDGVSVSIKKGSGVLWQQTIVNGNAAGFSYDVTTTVSPNETIDFIINKISGNSNDSTSFTPTIAFTAGGSPTDLNGDGATNVTDVQIAVNQAMGTTACSSGDVNKDGSCNVVDVQMIVNKSLGL